MKSKKAMNKLCFEAISHLGTSKRKRKCYSSHPVDQGCGSRDPDPTFHVDESGSWNESLMYRILQ